MKTSIVITTHGTALELPIMIECLNTQRIFGEGKHSRDGSPIYYAAQGYSQAEREYIITWDGPLNNSCIDRLYDSSALGLWPWNTIGNPKESGVGHHTREPGIRAATGDYIVLTNSDNYFMSGWLHAVNERYAPDVGVVYWNCINNLWRWGDLGGCKLKRGHIDLACVSVKADIAKKVGFPFRNYDGDWDYIDACVKEARNRGLRTVHINETLSVHN